MADHPTPPLFDVPFLRLFPWLRLLRCPGAAIDPKRLMLAALGLLLLHVGWDALGRVFAPMDELSPPSLSTWEPLESADVAALALAEPAIVVTAPFRVLFGLGSGLRDFVHAALAGIWVVVVWGLVGGTIARVAVVGMTKGERVGLLDALRFASTKALALIGTPLVPMLGIVVVGTLMAIFGLLYRLPGSGGAVVAGVLAILPLVGGLVLAMILVGLMVGWPLMHASVAAEAEDGFDAMSRSYAYIHQRPWHCLGYVAVAAVAGIAGLVFVDMFARLIVHLTAWSLSFGGTARSVGTLYGLLHTEIVPPAAASAHGFWLGLVRLVVHAWVYSYFWTVATAIYLLLRQDVDGTPWGRIAHESRRDALVEARVETEANSNPEGTPAIARADAPTN